MGPREAPHAVPEAGQRQLRAGAGTQCPLWGPGGERGQLPGSAWGCDPAAVLGGSAPEPGFLLLLPFMSAAHCPLPNGFC